MNSTVIAVLLVIGIVIFIGYVSKKRKADK
jgi:hypothetical protein